MPRNQNDVWDVQSHLRLFDPLYSYWSIYREHMEIRDYHHHFEIGFKSALYYTTALCFTFSDPLMRRMASIQKMAAIYINAK